MLSTFGTMSESERRRIGVRVANATREMARTGARYWLSARPPYGYRLVLTDEPHRKPAKAREGARLRRPEVDPAEAAIVTEIFERYAAGHGVRKICGWLDAEGVPTPLQARAIAGARPVAGQWAHSTVQGILRNPVYVGHLVWARTRARERRSRNTLGPRIHSGWWFWAVASWVSDAGVSGSPV